MKGTLDAFFGLAPKKKSKNKKNKAKTKVKKQINNKNNKNQNQNGIGVSVGGPRLSPEKRNFIDNDDDKNKNNTNGNVNKKQKLMINDLPNFADMKYTEQKKSSNNKRMVEDDDDDDDEEEVIIRSSAKQKKKRLKRILNSDSEDSESDFIPPDDDDEDDDYELDDIIQSDEDLIENNKKKKKKKPKNKVMKKKDINHNDDDDDDDDNDDDIIIRKKKQNNNNNKDVNTKHDLNNFNFNENNDNPNHNINRKKRSKIAKMSSLSEMSEKKVDTTHVIPKFLLPEHIMDDQQRIPTDPNYNPSTLYIPEYELKKLTDGQRQYWEIKSKNFDVVLFYKVGKFYELFDEDADIGHKELGLIYMKGKRRHSGFPEAAFQKYAKRLIAKGYKVARVEQTQTPEAMKLANTKLKGKKKQKVVKREVVSVLSPGTLVDLDFLGEQHHHNYLMSIIEEKNYKFGICYVDASTGDFTLGEFKDDTQLTNLRTVLAQIRPKEIVYPKNSLSIITQRVLLNELSIDVIRNEVSEDSKYLNNKEIIQILCKDKYFGNDFTNWPNDLLIQKDNKLSMSVLGCCVWYLNRVLLDVELLSMKKFMKYDINQNINNRKFMILDGQTLNNLEILENQNRKNEGTLLHYMDHCQTSFGKRLLKEWIARPLTNINEINNRLDIVDHFVKNHDLLDYVRNELKGMKDLERLISRIHAEGLGRDHNAIMYFNINKKRMNRFINLLDGLKKSVKISKEFTLRINDVNNNQSLLNVFGYNHGFPDIEDLLIQFENSFDRQEALKSGVTRPLPGMDEEFDECEKLLKKNVSKLNRYLNILKDDFNCNKIKYVHRNKEKYQIEIPIKLCRKVPEDFKLMSQTKQVKRYWTDEIQQLVEENESIEQKRDDCLRNTMRTLFRKFSEYNNQWIQALNSLAKIDCFTSLALTSAYQTQSCRPEFIDSENSFLELRDCIHPTIASLTKTNFIPNDTILGTEENSSKFILVSGPNMGGKSTVLRQSCIAVIMAQIGCYVPATKCKLTPVDQIFTRVGANDKIMQGQSTFLVELEETANILRHATNRSLVILDELGRGTSTFDGTAIAYAVIQYLSQNTGCLTLFSTHYHMLMEEFQHDKLVSMYHMDCKVDEANERVTFKYRFVPGTCPKSYGMNVARLAGLVESVINRAKEMSTHFERRLELAHKSTNNNNNNNNDYELNNHQIIELAQKVIQTMKTNDQSSIEKLRNEVKEYLNTNQINKN